MLFGHFVLALTLASPSADEIVKKILEIDTWGMVDAEVSARLVLRGKNGSTSEMAYSSIVNRYDPPRTRSIARFSSPADLAGAGFLQIQKKDSDDDRFLYLPDLKKSRRVGGSQRSGAFMGTDISYADLDNRDLREGQATLGSDALLGQIPCYRLRITPKDPDSPYTREELWVRKDNLMVVRAEDYDKASALFKTLSVLETKKAGDRVFVSRLLVTNIKDSHTTEMIVDKLVPRKKFQDAEFTVRNLEKL